MQNFLTGNEVRLCKAAQGAATTAVNGDPIDMANAEQVTIHCTVAVANAGNHLTVQQSATVGFEAAETLEGAKVVCANAGEVLAINVFRPLKRYVRGVVTRTASTATGDMYAIRAGMRTVPADNNVAEKIVSKIVASPDPAA